MPTTSTRSSSMTVSICCRGSTASPLGAVAPLSSRCLEVDHRRRLPSGVPQPTDLTRVRLRRVLRRQIEPARRGPAAPVAIEAHHVHGEPIPYDDAVARPYEPFAVGDPWGP